MRRSRSPKGGLEFVYERRKGAVVGFAVRGHAGFASAGRDIVCAAISALILSAAKGLREHCGARPAISDTSARYALLLGGGGGTRAQAVLETMISGLEAIARSYPGYLHMQQGKVAATGPRSGRAKT